MRVRFIALSALFPFLHPIYRHRKNAKASNAAAPNMRHARLELCKAKTQDVSQRGRTIINVAFLHFLHYFSLLHPIFPAQKSAGASNAAAPNMRIAACLAA